MLEAKPRSGSRFDRCAILFGIAPGAPDPPSNLPRVSARFLRHRIQITNAPIRENDQVAVAMDVADLGEPRLARPLMRRGRFVVERCRHVIEPNVFRFRQIRIAKQVLDSRANPSLLCRPERFERRDPCIGVLLF